MNDDTIFADYYSRGKGLPQPLIDLSKEVYLGDEFSPDGCRVWDAETKDKLDKDRFRQDLGDVVESYQLIASKLGLEIS